LSFQIAQSKIFLSGLSCIRQKRHITRTLNRPLGFPLTTGAIAAALARVYLAPMSQKLYKNIYVLVINILFAFSAKATVGLRPNRCKACLPFAIFSFYHFLPLLNNHQKIKKH
jgi:hypothetical protein